MPFIVPAFSTCDKFYLLLVWFCSCVIFNGYWFRLLAGGFSRTDVDLIAIIYILYIYYIKSTLSEEVEKVNKGEAQNLS